jgi:hypothetical protein
LIDAAALKHRDLNHGHAIWLIRIRRRRS